MSVDWETPLGAKTSLGREEAKVCACVHMVRSGYAGLLIRGRRRPRSHGGTQRRQGLSGGVSGTHRMTGPTQSGSHMEHTSAKSVLHFALWPTDEPYGVYGECGCLDLVGHSEQWKANGMASSASVTETRRIFDGFLIKTLLKQLRFGQVQCRGW